MNLNEFTENKKTKIVENALKGHFDLKIDFDNFNMKQTTSALTKIRGLIKESKSSSSFQNSHNNSTYLKLVMLEQALVSRLAELRTVPTRIVVENEEVQKSQVILAAQDMIDSIQKMLEQVSKMNVEELDAVVTGVKNEFGSSVGDSFMNASSETLTSLQTALQTAKNTLSTALGAVTGENSEMTDMSMDEPPMDSTPDLSGAAGGDMGEPDMDDMGDIDMSAPDANQIGRERR